MEVLICSCITNKPIFSLGTPKPSLFVSGNIVVNMLFILHVLVLVLSNRALEMFVYGYNVISHGVLFFSKP